MEMTKKILIIDESSFSRICSAILEKEGFVTIVNGDAQELNSTFENYNDFGLVITSYPYGAVILEKLKGRNVPTIILSDYMNADLMAMLEAFDKSSSHCMIKPLDYNKFKSVVIETMDRYKTIST